MPNDFQPNTNLNTNLASNPTAAFIDDLAWRGLIHQCTDEQGLRAHVSSGVRRGYAGFDPTSDSLTIGNLVPLLMLARFQRAGHIPVALMGGATGLIGDPSGKSAERTLQTTERVAINVEGQRRVFERILDFSIKGSHAPQLVNNIDWLGKLSFLDLLRDVGKHFSVNQMIQKDSVRDRLTQRDQGISYTEFSYMILQAYDFAHLYRTLGVTLQLGGSDQWGNITAGLDLSRKLANVEEASEVGESSKEHGSGAAAHAGPFGLTTPLITKSDGTKFGKSESGAVWCTADRTSSYALYQFWLNTADADVPKYLRTFTFLDRVAIEALEAQHATNPGERAAHRALAYEVTALLHGETESHLAEKAAKALFSGDIAGLPEATLNEAFANAPSTTHAKALLQSDGMPVIDVLIAARVCASKGQAKEFLSTGAITINGRKVALGDSLKSVDLLHGSLAAIRRGKKNWHLTRWT